MDFHRVDTEKRNPLSEHIDQLSTADIVKIINQEDQQVALAVQKELPHITKAVDAIVEAFQKGRRLVYVGAGTSGRLGVLDASECPPTYGVSSEQVVGLIAGGDHALRYAVEGAEDHEEQGVSDLKAIDFHPEDVLVGIAASGHTPYVIGALKYAGGLKATTISLVCTRQSRMEGISDITIAPLVGPEVVTGSTRMKAGTAQKMVLNMLTTASMIKIGKVYGNLMVDLQPTNVKLKHRAVHIIQQATGVEKALAEQALSEQNGDTKAAILQILTGIRGRDAQILLDEHRGHLRSAIEAAGKR
ncbi:N-acetylmuramic acid 6-phosphate etherase [Melghirimyces algeriensis]|uniref:N-acetylmuramic acid 6-phosphate etherase n=1 Tax=Melghirimyces algeriensis TaxID=910412 RepID=A0A521F814_9BACL|nr:N-acetylmuramic acid 6-phosphate etherase [Melghirimyces algeriensis]SMO92342.1 N-acetylmuramic acid 6-phosphate etherase [Melghirimyces algeriensis]